MLDRLDQIAALSPQAYRDCMARFAGAVSIVTTDGPAGRRGVTASAVVSVSDNPPTLLVCLNRNRAENRWFGNNQCIAINVLCADQIALARAFAGEGHAEMDDRFALGHWSAGESGAPILADARVTLDCRVREVQAVHTHLVVMAEAIGGHGGRDDPALIYLDRRYREL